MAYSKTRVDKEEWFNGSTLNGAAGYLTLSQQYTWTKTGQSNPNWRDKIRQGVQAGSPYSVTHWKFAYVPAAFHSKGTHKFSPSTKKDYTGHGVIAGNQSVQTYASEGTADAKALAKVYARIRAQRSHFNALLFAGELRESVRMVRNPAASLVKLMVSYAGTAARLRRNMKNMRYSVRSIEKALAGLWLEVQYGWKPLVSDIQSGAEAIARIQHGNADRRERVKARGAHESVPVIDVFSPSLGDYFPYMTTDPIPRYTCYRERQSEASVYYIVGLHSSLSGPAVGLAQQTELLGVTLENFVPTVYNLIPYSFLLDYFSNLGDVVEGAFTDTSNVAWIVKTVVVEDSTEVTSTFNAISTQSAYLAADYNPGPAGGTVGMYLVIRKTITRTTPLTLAMPSLTLNMPSGPGKWANMLALFRAGGDVNYRR